MNKFEVVVNGVTLDTYDNINVSMNYQIEDILDITKKTTNFTKTIILPGTQFNNKFFKHIFDVNVDTITFNLKKAIPTIIRIGEQQVLSGNLQLLNIIVNDKSVEYEVVIAGNLKTIITDFGEYSLKNIDLTEYNHQRSKLNITNSWEYTIKNFNTDISYGEPGNGYVYPYIIYGQHNDISKYLYTSNLFPSVYVKTIIDKMFQFVGYTYTSDFFNSEYFKKLIVPFVDDKLMVSEEVIEGRTTIVGVVGSGATLQPPLTYNSNSFYDNSINTNLKSISPVMSNPNTGGNWYKNYDSNGYWIPFNRTSGVYGSIEFKNPNNEWKITQSVNPPNSYAYYQCDNSGYYDINFISDVFLKFIHKTPGTQITYSSGNPKLFARIIHTRGNTTTVLQQTSYPILITPNVSNKTSPYVDTSNPITIDISKSSFYLEEGDIIRIGFGYEYFNIKWTGINNDKKILSECVVPIANGDKVTRLEVKPSNNILEGTNDDIDMNQILPDIKMKDFFVSILKMFNLITYDNPNKPNDIIIEPRDDFYKSRTKIIDWTYKLDLSQDVKITPMSELDASLFSYSYKEDDDYYNTQYLDEIKRVYGNYEISVDNDFSNQVKELDIVFSPTPDGQFGINDRVAPFFVEIEDNNLKPKKVKPRILFYGGLINTSKSYILKDNPSQSDISGTTLTQYPYCGMWDNPINPTYDLGFGSSSKIYYNSNKFPIQTLVEKFHRNTLTDIIDINSKLLEANFILTPKDISELDFRNIILIDNSYWRISKIKDYNPISSDKTTSVVLYKVNDISIQSPDNVDLSVSSNSCPNDIIKKYSFGKGLYFVSQSGLELTEDCCNYLGGNYQNGSCWANQNWEDVVLKDNLDEYSKLVVQGGNNQTTYSMNKPTEMLKDRNSIDSPGTIVRGMNNNVGYDVNKSIILGNNNSINSGYDNIIIIGDDISPDESGTIYIGNYKLNSQGLVYNVPYIIDGSEDEIMRVNKTNLIDKLDGTQNSVRNFGGDSKERPIIDGGSNFNI